jgi:hypothetical protein
MSKSAVFFGQMLKMAGSMGRRGLFYGFLVALMALLLAGGPFISRAPAQQGSGFSPPLGNLVREYDPITMPDATAYVVYTTSPEVPHQVWYRVSGGDALFRQRLQVFKENANPRPLNQLPPDSELQQAITTNNPTGWFVFPAEQGIFSYYFDGDNRPTPDSPWQNGRGIVVKRTRYENGNLFELGFEDKITLDDFNDLIVEVAVIQPA